MFNLHSGELLVDIIVMADNSEEFMNQTAMLFLRQIVFM